MFWKWHWRSLKMFPLKQDQNEEGVFQTERQGIALVTMCFWGPSPQIKKGRMQGSKTSADGVCRCVIKTYQLPSWLQTCDSCSPRPILNVLRKHCTPQQVAPDAPANQRASPYPLNEVFLSPSLQTAKVSNKQCKWIQEKSLVPPDREFWRVQLKKSRKN